MITGVITPEEKDINIYVSKYYSVVKSTLQVEKTIKNLIYKTTQYWLSSACAHGDFSFGSAYFI